MTVSNHVLAAAIPIKSTLFYLLGVWGQFFIYNQFLNVIVGWLQSKLNQSKHYFIGFDTELCLW